MSAANMNLNVQTLNQIGGALQSLSGDGTINQAGTQQLVAALQQQLGTNFAQTSLSDNLHTSFTAEGGFGAGDIAMIAFTIVVSIMTAGAASAAIGAVSGATAAASSAAAAVAADGTTAMATAAAEAGGTFMAATAGASAGLANIALSAGIAGMVSSAMSQLAATGSINIGSVFETGAIAGLTAGVTNGITYNSSTGLGFTTGSVPIGEGTSTLSQLAGVSNIGNSIVPQAGKAAGSLSEALTAMGASSALDAGIQTAIGGGSFLNNLTHDAVGDLAAAGAYAIGDALPGLQKSLGDIGGEAAYIGLHGALGCAASAAEGTGCAGGAIGGAASAAFSPDLLKAVDPTGADLDPGQQAAMAGFATLLGGGLAGLAGANALGGATAGQNEVLNNTDPHAADAAKNGGVLSTLASAFIDAMNANKAGVNLVQGQISQFLSFMQSEAKKIIAEPHWLQMAQGAYNGASAAPDAGGSLPGGPDFAPATGSTTGLGTPSATNITPSNATLSSNGNGDNTPTPSLGADSGGVQANPGSESKASSTVPPSILGEHGSLPEGIGGKGTPIPMPATADPNATAEQFATAAFNGQTPTKVLDNITGEGSWVAIMPDGTAITYRPAGQASLLTDPGTATVEVNSPAVKAINNGKSAKFKFPAF